ncbi:MFS transporter protein [Rutstroemia sp. NJR-2017a BVV2]|nr:MFS transporter protein [Rutstroemia sp. NJR-2017a BVV2]
MPTTTTTTITPEIELDGIPSGSSNTGKTEVGISEPLQDGQQTELDYSTSSGTPRLKGIAIITILTGVSFLNTMGSGILTIALPRLSQDLSLPPNLLLWPASVYALTAGCTLLIFGTVADVVGAKKIWLTGSCLYTMFTLACGLAQTGDQLIAFRTVLGVAIAMCLPSAVSLTTASFERGTWRNIGFACMGMGQPLGYSVGLILGGVFTNTIGWRYGYYISAIINAFLVVGGFLGLPSDKKDGFQLRRLITDIDWVGAICISTSLGLLSYILA